MKHKNRQQQQRSSSSSSLDNKNHKQITKHKNGKKKMKRIKSSESSDNQKRNKQHNRQSNRVKRQRSVKKQVKNQYQKLQPSQQVRRSNWSQSDEIQGKEGSLDHQQQKKKEQPNFEPSGILLQYYNARQGVSLKFHEPPEAHKPVDEWRVYPFKDGTPANPIILSASCYLIGKDQRVCDILCENQSISRQHAVIQFRSQYKPNIEGLYDIIVKPYIIDLGSTNGTLLNNEKLQPSRYYELLNKDTLKFGLSERQYVMFKVPCQTSEK